jgi:hypothetical protein
VSFPILVPENVTNVIPPELEWLFAPSFTSDDWREAVALYAPSQLGLGRKRSYSTLTGYIPFNKIKDACLYFLGWSWVDANKFLRRETPATHPIFHNLFATEILECVPVKFVVKAAKPHKWSLPYATYTLARMTVAYSQPPYEVLSDNDLVMSSSQYAGQECRRFFNWVPKPYVDLLEMPGGSMLFTDDRGPPPAGYDGVVIPGIRAHIRAEKSARVVTWFNVPIEFVCDTYGFMPKIESRIGKVNSDAGFFGQPAHTWLLDDVDTVNSEVYADPIATAAFEGFSRRVDLKMTFRHFNPTKGNPASSQAGWRLQPAADGKWYRTRMSAASGTSLPEEASFVDMFTKWNW